VANLVRVLEATLKGPRRSSQRPTNPRPPPGHRATVSAGNQPHFQPGTGPPTGGWVTNPSFATLGRKGFTRSGGVSLTLLVMSIRELGQ